MQSGTVARIDTPRKSPIFLKAAVISIPWARYWPAKSSRFVCCYLTAIGFISKAKSDTIDMAEGLAFNLSN